MGTALLCWSEGGPTRGAIGGFKGLLQRSFNERPRPLCDARGGDAGVSSLNTYGLER